MSDSPMHEASGPFGPDASPSARAGADSAVPSFLSYEPPAEIIDTVPLVSSSLGTSVTRTRRLRRDGWTPEARRTFLEQLAETGSVVDACLAAGRSAQSAYALATRDPLFDAGWNAAVLFSRRRLADELLSRAMNGVVEQVHRDGVVVMERHRHDNRLALAVLARMDQRLDRAEERGEAHLEVARHWEEYLEAIGEDRQEEALALLAGPEVGNPEDPAGRQLHQLNNLSKGATAPNEEAEDPHSVWDDEKSGFTWTNYPPPEDFDGVEHGKYGTDKYRRSPTEAELTIIQAEADAEYAKAEAQRDRRFTPQPLEGSEPDASVT
ncbi:MAG TPA: hypothetical protein VGR19_03405 [Allosphingosinicella sp.]|nr:hypothetical protein [Allosphingosinicella sp.]